MLNVQVKIREWPTKEQLENVVIERIKRYAAEIFEGVVKRSPVHSGAFRAAWRVSIGAPDYVEIDSSVERGSPLPPPRFIWPAGFQLGQAIFISNGQPYAERLEYGWSQQAPHGIVRVTLASVTFK